MHYRVSIIRASMIAFLLALSVIAFGQDVTLTVPDGSLHPGQTVEATAKLTNSLTPKPPIVLTATATYSDILGVLHEATPATLTLTVTQPLRMQKLELTLGTQLAFVEGSAKSSVPVAASVTSNVLTLAFDKTLLEGESLDIMFGAIVSQ